jgi:DNA replication and repair protein RecF
MTSIKNLHVQHLRSHDAYMIEFSPEVTIITGANGSGKTSLLEAIYVSLQGTSFKGSDGDLLKKQAPWWRIDISFDDEPNRVVKFDPEKVTGRKQFIIQLNPLYGPALRKYERSLRQRNNLLKNALVSNDELFPWNISLAEHGSFIIEQRIAFIEQINRNLGTLYQEIAGTHDAVSIHYSHTFVGDIKQKLLNELHSHLERDRYLGNTSVGPHRHDVIFQINDSPALSVASRGEARTIVLALKFLEVDIIEQLIDKQPIILLDDVFSELDANRQQLLTTQLKGHQIIITSATSHAGEHLRHIEIS